LKTLLVLAYKSKVGTTNLGQNQLNNPIYTSYLGYLEVRTLIKKKIFHS